MSDIQFVRNEKQLQVIGELKRNILLTAGAGTGKTDTLSERVAHIIDQGRAMPEAILCMTFTNKACLELKERIIAAVKEKGLLVTVKTFHSFCYDIVKTEAKKNSDLFTDFIIFDEDDCKELVRSVSPYRGLASSLQNFVNLVKQYRAIYDIYSENSLGDYEKVISRLFAEEKAVLKGVCRRSDYSTDHAMQELMQTDGAAFIEAYNQQLQDMHGLDFNDLTTNVYQLFKDENVRDSWRGKYKYINIDEMQDTSEVEYKILSQLFTGNNVLLCGDYFQTIYEWRGSRPASILPRYIEEFQPITIAFEENYRSTSMLLNASYSCLQNMFGEQVQMLYPKEIKSAAKTVGEKIIVKQAETIELEARWIFAEIKKLKLENISRTCILTRNNGYNQELSHYFTALNAKQPLTEQLDFILVDEFKFFRRQEIKDVLSFLKLIVNRNDVTSLKRILKRFASGIGEKTIETIESTEFREAGVKLTDFIDPKTQVDWDSFYCLLTELDKGNIVVFDVESTGINTTEDEIIQIAAVRLDRYGQVQAKFDRFLRTTKPVGNSYFVHGFSDEFLAEKGEDPVLVLQDFLLFSTGAVIVGHNVGYDIGILTSQLNRFNLEKPKFLASYDTLDIFRRFYPNLANHKLAFLSEHFELQNKPTHNAFADILATANLLLLAIEKNIQPTAMARMAYIEKYLKQFSSMANIIEKLTAQSYQSRPCELIAEIVKAAHIKEFYEKTGDEQRVVRIREFYLIAKDYDDLKLNPRDALFELLKMTALSNSEMDRILVKRPRIPIITVHQAKGTEFDYELLAGMQDNTFPSYQAIKNGNLEEEKRLFYVAITRAKKKLYLSSSKKIKGRSQTESQFIKNIPAKFLEVIQ